MNWRDSGLVCMQCCILSETMVNPVFEEAEHMHIRSEEMLRKDGQKLFTQYVEAP